MLTFVLLVLLGGSSGVQVPYAGNNEPTCNSRFDYDLRMFETIADMKHSQKALQDLVAKFEVTAQENVNKLEKLEAKVAAQAESISKCQASCEDTDSTMPIIGFKATGVTNKNPSVGDVLIFPTLFLNKGEGYNVTSGVFTAPVSGLYLLTAQTCITGGGYENIVSIMVQGREMGLVFTNNEIWSVCNSGNAIAYMDAYGEAFIETKRRSGQLQTDAFRMISFAGALLN